MLPGTKFLPRSGVINTSIGLLLGTLSIIVIERSYWHMLQQDINEGGEFSYILTFMGRKHAFVVGWFLFLAYLSLVPLNATAFPLVIDKLFPGVLNWGYLYTIAGEPVYVGKSLVSVAIVLLFMALNLKGMKQSGKAQFWIVAALIIGVISVFTGMLTQADLAVFRQNYVDTWTFDLGQIAEVVAITPFLFIGFDAVPQLVKDMDISRRKAAMIAVVSLLVGMSCYILLNFSTGLVYGPEEAKALDWALGSGVMLYLGLPGFLLLVIALGAAVSGGINGFTFKQVHVSEVRGLVESGAFIIDVREENEYALSHIKTAVNIPLSQIRQRLDEIPKDKPVYLHCRSSQRSYNAVLALQANGFRNVFNISGSFLGISFHEYFNDVTQKREPIVTNYNFN